MKPEIIHAKFPSKTSSALNLFTQVQSTPLTNINSGFLLMIGPNAAKSLMNKKMDVQIKVSIQNLKNETAFKESQIFYQKAKQDTDLSEDVYIDMDRSDGDTDSE